MVSGGTSPEKDCLLLAGSVVVFRLLCATNWTLHTGGVSIPAACAPFMLRVALIGFALEDFDEQRM